LIGELNPIIINTGSLLNNKINSLSGYVNSQDIVFSGQTASTGSILDNKINSLSGYVTGITGTFGTLPANLYSTGSILDNKINSLSGYLNSQDIILSGQIASTGSNLYNSILSLSGLFAGYTGSLDNTFATDAQLFSTGSILDNKINSLSGYVNNQDIIFSGQTFNTGSRLDNKINALSGYVSGISQGGLLPSTIVYITGDQVISGVKTFTQTGSFDTVQITNKKLSSYNYVNSNFTFGNTYINIANSSNNIIGTLPSGITSGINYYVKNLNTGILLITGSGQRTIDGFYNINLYKNESLQILGVNNVGYTGWVTLSADNGVS
jgi:hypothetical protein